VEAAQLQPPPAESQQVLNIVPGEAAQDAATAEASAESTKPAEPVPAAQAESAQRLTPAPTEERQQREPRLVTRAVRRAEPKPEGAAANGAREAAPEKPARGGGEVEGAEEGGPSKDQLRHYRRRWNKAESPEEKAEVLRYGAERGVPEAVALLRLLEGGQPKTEAQAPSKEQAPPAQAATAQGAQPQQPAQAGAPEEPKYMGQTRGALKRHAEAGAFIGNLAMGLGKLVGWTAPPEEMELFKDIPGFESIKAEGKPKERIAEIVTVELASISSKGGSEASPMRRRLELGLLIACTAGPGLLPYGAKLASAGLEKVAQVGGVVSRVVRRLRRR